MLKDDVDVCHGVGEPNRVVGVDALGFPRVHHGITVRVPVGRNHVVRQRGKVGNGVRSRIRKHVGPDGRTITCGDVDRPGQTVGIDEIPENRCRERCTIERVGAGVDLITIVGTVAIVVGDIRVSSVGVDFLAIVQAITITIRNVRFGAVDIYLGLVM